MASAVTESGLSACFFQSGAAALAVAPFFVLAGENGPAVCCLFLLTGMQIDPVFLSNFMCYFQSVL